MKERFWLSTYEKLAGLRAEFEDQTVEFAEGCWIHARDTVTYKGVELSPQTYALLLYVWSQPKQGVNKGMILRKCRNRLCCNPDHLSQIPEKPPKYSSKGFCKKKVIAPEDMSKIIVRARS